MCVSLIAALTLPPTVYSELILMTEDTFKPLVELLIGICAVKINTYTTVIILTSVVVQLNCTWYVLMFNVCQYVFVQVVKWYFFLVFLVSLYLTVGVGIERKIDRKHWESEGIVHRSSSIKTDVVL